MTRPESSKPLRTTLALMDLRPWRLLRAALLGALGVGSAVSLIGVSAWLIARASQHPPVLDLSVAVVAVRAFGIGRALFRYAERLASHDIALGGLVVLRERLFAALAAGDPRRALRLRRGDLLARLGADVDQVGDVLIKGVLPFGIAGIVCAGAAVTSLIVLPTAGLALVVALLVAAVLAPWTSARAARRAHDAAVEARAQISTGTLTHLESLDELRVAGALGRSRHVLDRWEDKQTSAIETVAGWAGLSAALQFIATAIAVVPALWLGSAAVEAGRIDAVLLAVLTLLPLAAIEACAALPAAAAEIVAGRRAAARLVELLGPDGDEVVARASDVDPSDDLAPARPSADLTATDLVVGWDRPLPNVPQHFRAAPGALTSVVGPSGSGKTTLALTLAGLLPPLSGQVLIADVPLAHVDELASVVSFTAHDAHIFGTTVRENLLVAAPRGTTDEALHDVARRVGLDGWLNGLPAGLDTSLRAGGQDISGGEHRRLLLARALLTGAPVLIVDEPTEHLDPDAATAVWAELSALAHRDGLTVIALTHDDRESADLRIDVDATDTKVTAAGTGVPPHPSGRA